jgi:hypothetical protein
VNFWDFQDYYVEMVGEKIDLRNLFNPVCKDQHVPLTNISGWNDINSRAAIMERFKYWEAQGRKCVLLGCGDHDPGGLHISDKYRSNLRDLTAAVGWSPDNLIIERFGLNVDFIERNNLTWIDNLETGSGEELDDPNHNDHYKRYVQEYIKQFGRRKCEANALVVQPIAGRELCRQAIMKYISTEGIRQYEAALAEEQEKMRVAVLRLLAGLRSGIWGEE